MGSSDYSRCFESSQNCTNRRQVQFETLGTINHEMHYQVHTIFNIIIIMLNKIFVFPFLIALYNLFGLVHASSILATDNDNNYYFTCRFCTPSIGLKYLGRVAVGQSKVLNPSGLNMAAV